MNKIIHSHNVTRIRRKGGEFKGIKCIVCGKPESQEHHPDYNRPAYTLPTCSIRCHNTAAVMFPNAR